MMSKKEILDSIDSYLKMGYNINNYLFTGDFMSLKFVPEYYFNNFNDITADFFVEKGIRGVVLDIDNTLEPYEHPDPGEHVISWLNSLGAAGIKVAFVSNNNRERVERFNSKLGLVAFYKAKKPFKKNIKRAMKIMCTDKTNTALLGDQIFTDIWAAHNAGIIGILVPPINDKRDILTRFKRLLEKPILKKYNKRKTNKIK